MLRELQAAFRTGILDDRPDAALALIGGAPDTAARRLALYRNNTLGSLAIALAAAFPVVERLVGPDFFRAAARRFVAEAPPQAPQLLAYGGDFPAFLDGFQPARSLPYLGDVARLEWARNEAWFAGEAARLTAADLASVPPDRLAARVLTLHPAVRLVASTFPIDRIWRVNQPEHETVARVDLAAGGETVLVYRAAGGAVVQETLSPGGHALVAALADGQTLGQAAEAAVMAEPGLDLQARLAGLIAGGCFAAD